MIIGPAEKATLDEIKYPPTIYKYREVGDEKHRTIITNKEVYFAPPNKFPDKYDCRNRVRYDLLNDNEVYEQYRRLLKEKFPSLTRIAANRTKLLDFQ